MDAKAPVKKYASEVFSIEDYLSIVRKLVARGYRLSSFEDHASVKGELLLRHDVDLSLHHALAMAEAEAEAGFHATYYVLVTSGMYNPMAHGSREILQQMTQLGHRIGLHFDATVYGTQAQDRAALEMHAKREIAMLEDAVGKSVGSLSFHRPAQSLLGLPGEFAGVPHAYEPRFFENLAYCSDSGGGWFHQHPLEQAEEIDGQSLQLLTHPIWWIGQERETGAQRIETMLDRSGQLLRHEVGRNIKPFADYLADRGERDPAQP